MKFVITMNMPSVKSFLVHQITVDMNVNSCSEFCEMMNNDEFIIGKFLYRRPLVSGGFVFEDRGEIIINTAHIGKVQEYYELAKDYDNDESYGHSESSYNHPAGERGSVRKRRINL